MKTNNDDFSGKEYPKEQNIRGVFDFNDAEGAYYKVELDFSPSSFLSVVAKNCVRKPFPWSKFKRFTDEEMNKLPSGSRKKGIYSPAPNVNQIIASMVQENP